jgi:hypothetical protein
MTRLVEQQSDVCTLRDAFEDSKNESVKIHLLFDSTRAGRSEAYTGSHELSFAKDEGRTSVKKIVSWNVLHSSKH